ncbi:MAG: capsular polysaccharide synthesis protein [Clostridia bacterium]|nr:capsular polysaccharide synthesis protein [Bacilli bacterium]MBR3511484.1 capsular polysaccharide synthesis protein [Clostridia bacterium]
MNTGEFLSIFKKVNGLERIKDFIRNHMLIRMMVITSLVGTSKKSLEIVRNIYNYKLYKKIKKKNKKFIETFVKENDFSNIEHNHEKIIWTIWLQGMENAPEIVQKCYKSMKDNLKGYKIIVITENNYKDYISFPDYILEKYEKGIISKVHFADLIRIELMATHGGTWLDGTVFCSHFPKEKFFLESDLFLFQKLKPGLDGHIISVSSWFITASSNQPIIMLTRALLHNFWKKNNCAFDYFMIHFFIQISIETYQVDWEKVVPFSNSTPHILLLRLFEEYDKNTWEAIKSQTPFHKLSHKFSDELKNKPNTFYKNILDR